MLHPVIGGILTVITHVTTSISFAVNPLGYIAAHVTNGFANVAKAFAHYFLSSGNIDFQSIFHAGTAGKTSIGAIVIWCTAGLAVIAVMVQAAKMAFTGDGRHMGKALTGLVRVIAVAVGGPVIVLALLSLSSALTTAIVHGQGFSSSVTAFTTKLVAPLSSSLGSLLLIVLGLIAIVGIAILFVEMLARAAGIVILVLTLPLAAAGSMLDETPNWWGKARSQLIALIFLKPVIAVIFAIGFLIGGVQNPGGTVQGALVGLMTLALACIAWPVLAKYLTFYEGSKSGMGGALGGAAIAGGGMAMSVGMMAGSGGAAFAGGAAGGAAGGFGGGGGGGGGLAGALEASNTRGGGAPSGGGGSGGAGARGAGAGGPGAGAGGGGAPSGPGGGSRSTAAPERGGEESPGGAGGGAGEVPGGSSGGGSRGGDSAVTMDRSTSVPGDEDAGGSSPSPPAAGSGPDVGGLLANQRGAEAARPDKEEEEDA